MNECIVCKKEIPEPVMICFNCSTNKKEETLKAMTKMAIDIQKNYKSRNPLQ